MDIDVQEFSSFGGFADDDEYSNLFGIGKKAKKIDAQTAGIKAQSDAVRAAADAESQRIAKQLSESEKATKDALLQAEMIKKQLEEVKATPTVMPQSEAKKGMNMPLIIGGGIAIVGIVLVLILKK